MAVTAELIQDDARYAVLKITNDGATDESAAKVTKLDASTLVGAPTNVKIKHIIAGCDCVARLWGTSKFD